MRNECIKVTAVDERENTADNKCNCKEKRQHGRQYHGTVKSKHGHAENDIRQTDQQSPDHAFFFGKLYIGYNAENTACQYEKLMLHANPIRAPIGWKKQYTPTKAYKIPDNKIKVLLQLSIKIILSKMAEQQYPI